MDIFISWSKPRSKSIALALRDWIPKIVNAAHPWMSETDIPKGKRWSGDIAVKLQKAKFGIICLTPENLTEPWLLFEAGALAKTLDEDTFLCPYLLDLVPSQIRDPLGQFQASVADRKGTSEMLVAINTALREDGISQSQLEEMIEICWPHLAEKLARIQATPVPENGDAVAGMSPQEQINELLIAVRDMHRLVSRVATDQLGGDSGIAIQQHINAIVDRRLRSSEILLPFIEGIVRQVNEIRKLADRIYKLDPAPSVDSDIARLCQKVKYLDSYLRRELGK